MNIIFYNTFAIGDIFFNKPFLKHLCLSNPTIPFQIHTNIGSSFMKDIPNLRQIDTEDGPLHSPVRYTLFKYFEQFSKELFIRPQPHVLGVNTWVGALNSLVEGPSCECNPGQLYLAFQRLVETMNTLLPYRLEFPPMVPRDFLYKMPSYPLENFLQFKKNVDREILFYFNRMGMSSSYKPFATEDDQKQILARLSALYPNKLILVPNAEILPPHCSNIVLTQIFGPVEDHRCDNVLWDMEIAGHSTYAVFFDIGACLTYCNDHFIHYTAKMYHLSKDSRLCRLAKQGLEDCFKLDTSRVEYVPCSTPDKVVQVLQQRIS